MSVQPKLHRVYRLPEPQPFTVEFHAHDCLCSVCAPDRLDAVAIGKLACAAAAVTTAVFALIDPAATIAALLAPFGWHP